MKNDTREPIIILVVLIGILIISATGGSKTQNSSTGSNTTQSTVTGTKTLTPNSPQANSITMTTGNARSVYQPNEEYITIYNKGRAPLDITGWRLQNAKDERGYDFNGTLRNFQADSVTIGQGAPYISPQGFNISKDIVLQPGDMAIINTGNIGSQSPYKITSFKENICSGYLEDLTEYTFTPSLSRNCPLPSSEPGVAALDTECRQFIDRMPSCHTPEFNTKDREGNTCSNCVDNKVLSGSCVAFIKAHFDYGSCIAYHLGDANFSKNVWRVFLNNGWELWAQKYETIKLFDRLGQLVTFKSY